MHTECEKMWVQNRLSVPIPCEVYTQNSNRSFQDLVLAVFILYLKTDVVCNQLCTENSLQLYCNSGRQDQPYDLSGICHDVVHISLKTVLWKINFSLSLSHTHIHKQKTALNNEQCTSFTNVINAGKIFGETLKHQRL